MRRLKMASFVLMLLSLLHKNSGFCDEGRALLRFRERVEVDPFGALSDWGKGGLDPCSWFGVRCSDLGRIVSLNLEDLCLKGTLAPELGKLVHMKSLILSNNSFYGTIPEEIGDLQKLQVLDLGHNNLRGPVPSNLGRISSLEILVPTSNECISNIPPEILGLNILSGLKVVEEPSSERGTISRNDINATIRRLLQVVGTTSPSPAKSPSPLPPMPRFPFSSRPPSVSPSPSLAPVPSTPGTSPSPTDGPDAFVPESSNSVLIPPLTSNSAAKKHAATWVIYVLAAGGFSFLLALSVIYVSCCRNDKVVTVMPWSTGLSGQLQKALVTGVPSLKRSELERACEEFSNIIGSLSDGTLYKGTLSSGVEIAVTSSMITSAKDWSDQSEAQFRNKISTLSKVNHKNFMNLIGYCEEEEPFTRMLVFEYAPNGTLFEHLHIKEAEHLNWAARLRIAMGIAYCLQHMHQLNPPAILRVLHSSTIYLTDDYAAKISDLGFFHDESEPESEHGESIVYKFGIILLEIVSGRRPFSKDDGLLVLWASCYLTGQRPLTNMVDSTLESVCMENVTALLEVIRICISPDPTERPTMTEVVGRLREITSMPPNGATPKLSPLWWAELEIISSDVS